MRERLARNLEKVKNRIAAACARFGREPADVTLIAVTKTVGPEEVRTLYDLGVRDFGENRVANGEAQKRTLGMPDARWHLIGHLQRNKATDALDAGFSIIHSAESEKLLDVLDREAAKRGQNVDILIEVNISGEDAKYGMPPEEAAAMARRLGELPNLRCRGLMTMAPLTDDPETSRPIFAALRALRDELEKELGVRLPELSMGMSGDYGVAVEEGATMVRVGTALFL